VYIALLKNRSTEEMYNKILAWIDHVNDTWGKVKSITTDNELYNNRAIMKLFLIMTLIIMLKHQENTTN